MKSTTSRINRKYNNIIGIALILAIAAVLYAGHYFRHKGNKGYVLLEARPIQSRYGWGYEVLASGKLYIHQEFIPVIAGRKGFASKEQALRVGNKVIEKIKLKQIPPTLTLQDLTELGVVADSARLK